MQHSKKLYRIAPKECLFMECDIQEKFRKHILSSSSVIHNARRLALTAKVFKIPIISTQQMPQNFGATCKEIADAYDQYPEGSHKFEKV